MFCDALVAHLLFPLCAASIWRERAKISERFLILAFAFPSPSAPLRVDEFIGSFRRALFELRSWARGVRPARASCADARWIHSTEGSRRLARWGGVSLNTFFWPHKESIQLPVCHRRICPVFCEAKLQNRRRGRSPLAPSALPLANYPGTNTAELIPKNLPNLPAKVALIFRLPDRIADRLLCGTIADRSSCFNPRSSIKKRSTSLGSAGSMG